MMQICCDYIPKNYLHNIRPTTPKSQAPFCENAQAFCEREIFYENFTGDLLFFSAKQSRQISGLSLLRLQKSYCFFFVRAFHIVSRAVGQNHRHIITPFAQNAAELRIHHQ